MAFAYLEVAQHTITKLRSAVASLRGRPRTGEPAREKTLPALDVVNDEFHRRYAEARQSTRQDGPIFVVLADDLIVFHHDRRSAFPFSPRAFHVIKSVVHAPVALYSMFERDQAPSRVELASFRERSQAALDSTRQLGAELAPQAQHDLEHVLRACMQWIDALPAGQESSLSALAAQLGPVLLRLAKEATKVQLDALHAHTERALAQLSEDDRAALHVVVAGDHQARDRSLPMQYFAKRLEERAGQETRLTYAEGVSDEQAAVTLVGTQRLDRKLARSFFGEEKRLQRDILGDAAKELLRGFDVRQIE